MIKEFCEAWEVNKDRLRNYISTHKQGEYDSYENLVKILFQECVNPYCKLLLYCADFNFDDLTTIDNGEYQGTLIFLIPTNTYDPSVTEYVFTYVNYGSCSGCDTLQGIHRYESGYPTEGQVNDYMELLLHLLQHCRWLIPREEEKRNDERISREI